MKILVDCVLTAEPAKCSSNVQFLTFVKRTLKTCPDVYFYWLIPEWVTQKQFLATYPQSPNVKYIPVPQHKDRTKEYLTLSHQLDAAVAFNGPTWDFDVLLTMRTGLCPLFKLLMMSPRHNSMAWTKEIWLIEEMPLMDFKKTVMTINGDVQDLYTLSGYLAADKAYICSYHEKPAIVRRAREFLTPSHVKEIAGKLQPICTTQFSDFRLKMPEEFFVPGQKKPFCISYVGRMEKANRIEEINDLMVKQFVMKGDAVRLLVCTQSKIEKVFDKELVDVRMANREEFWSLAQNDMHVMLKMSVEGGFSLSLLEPMMFGVPAILSRAAWSEALVGTDYPFLVKNETQAYALVSEFYRDYAGMYAQYAEWQEKVFQPLFKARFKTDLLYDHLDREIARFQKGVVDRFRDDYPGKKTNSMVLDVLEEVGDAQEFVFQDIVERLVAKKKMDRKMVEKLMPEDRDQRGLVWSTGWNEFRLAFKAHYGWEDASTTTGHMKKSAQ